MNMLVSRILVSLLLAFGCSIGCSSNSATPKEPEKCKLQILTGAIIASPYINPTVTGEARPVQLRLYQLKNDTGFLNASFEQIWQDDKTALGDTLVKVEEMSIYPNTRVAFKFERDDSAQFLIAAALFREPKGRTWFTSFELPPPPSAGACGAKCTGPECDAGVEKDNRIYIWIDGMVVQDGAEHVDDFPLGRVVNADGMKAPVVDVSCDSATKRATSVAADSSNLSAIQPPTIPNKP